MTSRSFLLTILMLALTTCVFADSISPGKDMLYTSTREVSAMVAAPDDSLWAATTGGVLRRTPDGTWRKYTILDGLPSCEAWGVQLDGVKIVVSFQEGPDAIWENGSWILQSNHQRVSTRNDHGYPSVVFQGKSYRRAMDGDGILQVQENSAWHRVTITGWKKWSWLSWLIVQGDELWAMTERDGVWAFDGKTWVPKDIGLPDKTYIRDIVQIGSKLWIGTQGWGIWEYDGKSATKVSLPDELCDNDCQSMRMYKGRLYVGTLDNGLAVRSSSGWECVVSSKIWSDAPRTMIEFNGILYVSNGDGYADGFDGSNWVRDTLNVPRGHISALAADDKRIYAAQWGGWSEFDGKTWSDRLRNPSLQGNPVTCLLPDGDTLWVGTQGLGLAQVDELTGKIQWHDERNGLADDWVTCLRKIDGTIYAGTFYDGLIYYDGKKWTVAPGLGHQRVNDIVPDGKGGVLVATIKGVWRFRDGHMNKLFTKPNSPDREANCLCVTDDGLWIGTRTGVFFAANKP